VPEINRVRVNERPPMRQYILATTPGGRTERWSVDAPLAEQRIEDLNDSDSVPGGFKELTGTLPRKPGVDYSDMKMGTKIEVFGAGQLKVGEYRLERAPRSSGDHLVMDPAASGYQVLLTDDEGARGIFIDADMSGFGPPSARRVKEMNGFGHVNQDGQSELLPAGDPKSGEISLAHKWATINGTAAEPDDVESVYDAAGIELGKVLLDFINVKGGGGSSWKNQVWGMTDDIGFGANGELLKDFNATTAKEQSIAIGAGRRYLMLQSYWAATLSANGDWEDHWRNIKVLDRHGLPLYGTWPKIGVLASDVVGYLLSKWAPGLSFSTGSYGSIKPSSFVIPHLAFKDPTTTQEMITQAVRFELLEWGVWAGQSGPTFYLNQRGQREGRRRWRTRMRPAKFTETGQQMDQVWNRVVVSWPDFDGTTKTVGPPGSGYPVTSTRCEDTDPLNPINEAGEDRTKHIALNDPATLEGAEETAERFLEQAKLLDGSGEATLTGFVEDEHGAEWPYYCVHAGDEIEFLDASIKGYRYIVEAKRRRKERAVGIKIDAPPDSYAALLERIGAREASQGVS
jgi:hypothetical protein